MRNILYISAVLFSFIFIFSFTASNTSDAASDRSKKDQRHTIKLKQVDNSGVWGMAVLRPKGDDRTMVSVSIRGAQRNVEQPVHIHSGTCDNVGEARYILRDVSRGISETIVDASVEELKNGNYVINVQKSIKHMDRHIVCGEI